MDTVKLGSAAATKYLYSNRGCKNVWCCRSRGKRISRGSSSKRFWNNGLHVQNYDYKDLEQIGEHMSKQNSIVCATYSGAYTEGTEFISNSPIVAALI
ncbi:MAG: hypothetical protein DLM72_12490 [Candidatus Nitrosopolaris wilkensis]|nr:MAG: hypothetical protein DLM72_12490 [Candidatus Nitrosopolaris wilkensis]